MEDTMEQKPKEQSKPNIEGNQQRSYNEGGHQGGGAHGGQHSGGLGGEHGGGLHDAGSAQSGMTGRGGMGGNDSAADGCSPAPSRQGQPQGDPGNRQDDLIGTHEAAEVQQSAQREGMGHHRHSGRANEQDLDTPSDEGDLGSHSRAAGKAGG
jgi:hypothetical protein